jgi:hypothetical protein
MEWSSAVVCGRNRVQANSGMGRQEMAMFIGQEVACQDFFKRWILQTILLSVRPLELSGIGRR